jgi:hypothetical protein
MTFIRLSSAPVCMVHVYAFTARPRAVIRNANGIKQVRLPASG